MTEVTNCPICNGKGVFVDNYYHNYSGIEYFSSCYFCSGTGWVTIVEENFDKNINNFTFAPIWYYYG